MDSFAQAALSNAVIVSILAPVVLLVDRAARRPALAHRLWLLLLIKLVTPPLVPLRFPGLLDPSSPPTAVSAAPPIEPSGGDAQPLGETPTDPRLGAPRVAGLDGDPFSPEPGVSGDFRETAWRITFHWGPSLAGLWLGTSGYAVAFIAALILRANRRLAENPAAPADVQAMAGEVARKLALEGAPPVFFLPETRSPALWSLAGRSRLLVPEDLWVRLDEAQRTALLAHELAHLRRRDHWIRPLELLVLSFYWWFPVAWWMRRSLRESEEQCCDAWVVWLLPESKGAYARTLLDTIDFLAGTRLAVPLAASGLGTVATVKARLHLIMKASRPRRLSRAGTAGVAAATLFAILPAWQARVVGRGVPRAYRVVDLGAFDPVALNNVGQVVGTPMGLRRPRAYRWERGHWTELSDRDGLFVTPTDINDRGQVTGWYEVLLEPAGRTLTPNGIVERPETNTPPHAFRTGPNRPIVLPADDLGSLGAGESRGLAINNAGQVAGTSALASTDATPPDRGSAFRTAPDRPIDPRTDRLDRSATIHGVLSLAMNNLGDVVIQTERDHNPGGGRPSFHAAPGRVVEAGSPDLMPDAGLGGLNVKGINDRGRVIAGFSGRSREPFAGSVSFDLGHGRRADPEADGLPRRFRPERINNNGLILGTLPPSWAHHPLSREAIYDGRRFHRLSELLPPGSGWMICRAVDINDRNQVVGEALGPDRSVHGVLLDPDPGPAALPWIIAGTVLTGLGRAAARVGTGRGRDRGDGRAAWE